MGSSVSRDEIPLWRPGPERIARANLTSFIRSLQNERVAGTDEIADYATLYAWSVEQREAFWPAVWRFCDIRADERPDGEPWEAVGRGLDRMAPPDREAGPCWFPGARLNFAENLLRWDDARPAVIALAEDRERRELSHAGLRAQTARVAAALARHGIRAGDRVAAYVPNIPEAVIGMLGAASLGAVWSTCSPDFGVAGVVDRFGQIAPRVLFTVDGYRYAGQRIELLPRAAQVIAQIPGIERGVVIADLDPHPDVSGIPRAVGWDDWLGTSPATLRFVRLPFDHPLFILYSSGTTGLPKCMVHGAGGTLLQHLKELVLHTDLARSDRIFYFTTCGWMMWNWLVSSLAVGATVVLYDGAPLSPGKAQLWDMAAAEGITVFGTSAKYLALAEKEGLAPARSHDVSALRAILSTGSPLAEHSYDYVYRDVKQDVHLASISGGT